MTPRNRALLLIVIQCLLVSSIAAKYLYERVTLPRVWARTAQYDPELPMRGRYFALSPEVDICKLTAQNALGPQSDAHWIETYRVRLVARDGKLVAEDARNQLPRRDYQSATINERNPCDRARVWPAINLYVPERAKSPFDLKPGQELWVEVTVPPSGPPRAIQLALSENGKWRPLKFE